MSSVRSIVWLLFFVLLAAGAHVLVSVRAGRTVLATRPETLVPGADRATSLEIARRDAVPVTAVRSDGWRLTAPFASAVETDVLLRALDALAFAPVTDVLTEGEMHRLGRSFADFGLGDPPLRLAVCGEKGGVLSVGFGRLTPAGDGVYARVGGRAEVCVVATNVFAALDLSLERLRSSRLLAEGPDDLAGVDVRRASDRFVRVSREAGAWKMLAPTNAPVASARVASLVSMLREARALRFVWPVAGEETAPAPAVSLLAGYGLDAESAATVTLTAPDGSTRYVSFGKDADGRTAYALVQNGGAIVTVPTALRERIFAEAASFADLRLFPQEESAVSSLSVSDGETAYLLARAPDGAWRLDSPVSAPADAEAVQALIRTVLALRTTEREEKGLFVSVSSNTPALVVSRDAVLVQNRLEDLRSKTVLRIPSDRIRRLTVTAADGRTESALWDASNRTWLLGKPDGATLNGLALAGALGALDPLTARAVVRIRIAASEAGNYGLENPRFTIAVDPLAEDAVRRNILIGAPAPDGGVYATVGSNDAVFVLPDGAVRALTASFAARQ